MPNKVETPITAETLKEELLRHEQSCKGCLFADDCRPQKGFTDKTLTTFGKHAGTPPCNIAILQQPFADN